MVPARPVTRRLLGVLFVVALAGAACGEDSGGSGDLTGPDAATSDTSTDGVASDGSTSDDTEPSDGDGGQSTDVLIEEYCGLSAEADASAASFAGLDATTAEAEAFFREQLRLTRLGVAAAPDTMREAITTQADFIEEAIELLDGAGWDLAAVNDELAALGATPERVEALDRLETFDRDECEVRFGEPIAIDPGDESDPAPVASDDPYCTLSAELGTRPGLPFDGTADDVEAYYDGLLADVDAAFTLAPESLKGSFETINDTFGEVYRILDGYNFDLDAAGPDLDAFSADPAVDGPMRAAVGAVENYDVEVCGLT